MTARANTRPNLLAMGWRPWWTFAIVAACAAGLILWLGRELWWFNDDCSFLTATPWTLHNGHPSVVPVAAFRLLALAFGTSSYLPFQAMTVVAHVAFAAAVYALFTRRGPVAALAAGSLALLLGLAWENIYWATGVAVVASTAAGLWALLATEQRRYTSAGILLVVALLSSAMGVPFLVAALLMTRSPVLAALAGIVVEYALIIAAGRSELASSRYLHTVAAFAFVAAAHLPWPSRHVTAIGYAALLAVNVVYLVGGPATFSSLAAVGFACAP